MVYALTAGRVGKAGIRGGGVFEKFRSVFFERERHSLYHSVRVTTGPEPTMDLDVIDVERAVE